MTKLPRLYICALVVLNIVGCNYDRPEGPEVIDVTTAVQQENIRLKKYWMADYWSSNPRAYGIRTYEWLDSGESFTSMMVGVETVPYETGAMTGVKMVFGDGTFVFRTERKRLWWLKEDEHYLSADCDLTAYPADKIFGQVYDGMIHDMSAPAWEVKDDFSECRPCPGVDGDSWVNLVHVRDVIVHGKKYINAVVFWDLEPGEPFKEINFFDGYEHEMGLTLPTADETNGWAIDDIVIFGFKKGILAVGNIDLETGNLSDLAVLVSIAHHHRPPDGFEHTQSGD
ncbi:MAG: hypothetical protein JSW50_03425 [Candidatus Latescibacterota bacterium]|nr:MAG: hypothetical protein JSW50_03425 [Candidatus Latescibacterota bacterium]